MKERPILFSGPMVRAILEDRKWQTRRVIKPQPFHRVVQSSEDGQWYDADCINPGTLIKCTYAVGQRLWVKETFRHVCDEKGISCIQYRSDLSALHAWATDNGEGDFCQVKGSCVCPLRDNDGPLWKPSIFMPRWASRITLEITAIRVERLQDISQRDCIAEGIELHRSEYAGNLPFAYAELWDSLNAKTHPWQSNPWVWVVSFKKV